MTNTDFQRVPVLVDAGSQVVDRTVAKIRRVDVRRRRAGVDRRVEVVAVDGLRGIEIPSAGQMAGPGRRSGHRHHPVMRELVFEAQAIAVTCVACMLVSAVVSVGIVTAPAVPLPDRIREARIRQVHGLVNGGLVAQLNEQSWLVKMRVYVSP